MPSTVDLKSLSRADPDFEEFFVAASLDSDPNELTRDEAACHIFAELAPVCWDESRFTMKACHKFWESLDEETSYRISNKASAFLDRASAAVNPPISNAPKNNISVHSRVFSGSEKAFMWGFEGLVGAGFITMIMIDPEPITKAIGILGLVVLVGTHFYAFPNTYENTYE